MPFNSYTFFIFFIIVLALYASVTNWSIRKNILLGASYLFYSAWNPLFVLLLLFSTQCDWFLARKIDLATSLATKRFFLITSILVNIGLLCYFKYSEFLINDMLAIIRLFGIEFTPVDLGIILPVGISFYSFQTLSYSIDVYRGKIKPGNSFLDYALYVSFFPQLVAGPIVRAGQFLPQCLYPKQLDMQRLGWGVALTVTGLFMKVVLADAFLAPVVDRIYAAPMAYGRIETWAVIFAYSGQIFCDFAGYSTAAVGLALCFGFDLPHNFKAPYAAIGFSDFWQRWHISLSSWYRDYLYIGLGGNRSGDFRTGLNLFFVMLLVGLWHGASWMFILWGCLHGLYLIIEKVLCAVFASKLEFTTITKYALLLFTYLIVSVTWVFFRSPDMDTVWQVLGNIFQTSPVAKPIEGDALLAALIAFLILCWQMYRRDKTLEQLFAAVTPVFRGVILFCQLVLIYLFSEGDARAFIYFQF